jgi:poly(hydroxyalkanoate) depolymerase family esterase
MTARPTDATATWPASPKSLVLRGSTMSRAAFAVALCVLVLLSPSLADAATGSITEHQDAGLSYWLDIPSSYPGGASADASGVPLVVFLDGCTEAANAEAGTPTGWEALAETKGFIAVFPVQPDIAGTPGCWWFTSPTGNSSRGQGQPAQIAAITQQVISKYRVDRRRVYLDGFSAGGTMASVMGATYPDLYAAIGTDEGCPYMCIDDSGALAYAAMGSHARMMPVFIVTGTTGGYALGGEGALRQWLLTDERVSDGGELNGSISQLPAHVTVNWSDRFGVKLPWTDEIYNDNQGRPLIERWVINGMMHEYPGPGDPIGPGLPDATAGAWSFFAAHPFPSAPPSPARSLTQLRPRL